jgi:hypothetical protein
MCLKPRCVYFILGLRCVTSWFDCNKLFTALRGQDIAMNKRMKITLSISGNIISNYVLVFLPEDG